jgi:hypothetical protein
VAKIPTNIRIFTVAILSNLLFGKKILFARRYPLVEIAQKIAIKTVAMSQTNEFRIPELL